MIMADKKIIGKRIKFIRLSAGLSRLEFGRKLEYSVMSINKWESGSTIPYPKTLAKIAKIGQTSIKRLIEPDTPQGALLLDKETALSLHSALYIILTNDRFLESNKDDAKRLNDIDKRAMEIMHSE